jgi:hypothetical protein
MRVVRGFVSAGAGLRAGRFVELEVLGVRFRRRRVGVLTGVSLCTGSFWDGGWMVMDGGWLVWQVSVVRCSGGVCARRRGGMVRVLPVS